MEPRLQPPGAGLPAWENFFLRRIYFPLFSKITPVDKALSNFKETTNTIIEMVSRESLEDSRRRILIPRITGIEDSSRYWSILMVLEHLILVTEGITQLTTLLAAAEKPDIQVRVAEVKPAGILGEDGIERFRKSMDRAAETLGSIQHWSKAEELFHPWLGFLYARQWVVVLALHQKLHKRQIELILAQLHP